MDATDRFLRFAAECEDMAKFTRSPENKAVWNGLAQRWLRCAELLDHREDANAHAASSAKRQRGLAQSVAH